jgi:hypothetical protein
VAGRPIELVLTEYFPIVDDLGTCQRLTEDTSVFAVVGPMFASMVDCIADNNETVALTSYTLSDDQLASTAAPTVSLAASAERVVSTMPGLLAETGAIGGRSFAVVGLGDDRPLVDAMVSGLADEGADVVDVASIDTARSDETAIEGLLDVSAERWRADGTTDVVVVGGIPALAARSVGRAGLDVRLHFTSGEAINLGVMDGEGVPREVLVDATAITTLPEQGEPPMPRLQACIDRWDAARPDEPILLEPTDELDNLIGIQEACGLIELLDAIGDEVTGELTNESFSAAIDAMGPVSVSGAERGSLGPDKRDVNDGLRLLRYDVDSGRFVVVAEAQAS